ncbi:hypothetical protein [Halorubrum sp. DTA98]|uniref:hypothetical protein n=1 Tax=Halorubrum sp. DTA98 TaxID=3402163 RepID=UPI003AAA7F32
MSTASSRWSRRFVLVGVASLCLWQVATLAGAPRRTVVTLGLFGFAFHVVFGKAYTLLPAYFGTDLAFDRAPAVQFPLVVVGTACLAVDPLLPGSVLSGRSAAVGGPLHGTIDLAAVGSVLWLFGVVVFVGTLVATVAGPLRRGETGTGDHNADRRPLDRFANAFVPVVLGYLLVGSAETAAIRIDAVPALIGVPAAATHLLAVGAAALLVFVLGFRLLPRFFGAHPTRRSAVVVLPAGAVAPLLLAVGFLDGRLLAAGAALLSLAVVAFAVVVVRIGVAAKRRRVGVIAVIAGVAFGIVGVALGVFFAFAGGSLSLVETHLRVNLLGFLGLLIVGVSFQFNPPSVGVFPGSSDRLATLVVLAIVAGLAIETLASLAIASPSSTVTGSAASVRTVGHWLALVGAVGYGYLVASTFAARSY